MSLAPKIDEVRSVMSSSSIDLACIVETWLQEHIHDNIISIPDFNVVRRDRIEGQHGGICVYVRRTIRYKVLQNLFNTNFEAIWLVINPPRLPRGISNIILCIVYHPPRGDDLSMLNYLYECLTIIEAEFPSCGIIMLGDFNKLNTFRLQNGFKLKQIIKFPTRGQNTLDLILTNLKSFYGDPIKLPPFGLSDHVSIQVLPLTRSLFPKPTFRINSRDLRPTKRLALSKYLEEVDVNTLVNDQISCEKKAEIFELIIKTGLDVLLPTKSKVKVSNEPPWMTQALRSLIHRRQKALASGDLTMFRSLRNQVNRERKSLRAKFYEKRVKHLKSCAPATWWREVKRLCGMSEQVSDRENTIAMLHNLEDIPDSLSSNPGNLANLINRAFLAPMSNFNPLPSTRSQTAMDEELHDFCITEFSVFKKLAMLNPSKAGGPDCIPGWVLKENADLLAAPISNILNSSFIEARVPQSWKHANIIPIPKEKPVRDVNKHLRPISLTPIVSKLAEDYVVSMFVKPAVLKKIDPNQYGTVPNSSTTQALASMLHSWNSSTDGNGATTRVVLFDFKKAFDLIDHHLLIAKLATYDIPQYIIMWITDFLSSRKQRVKLSHDCCSEWESVPAGVPQGTKLGPWLFVIMINDWDVGASEMWKYVDDTSMAETIKKGNVSSIQDSVDELAEQALANKFQLNQSKCKELRIGFTKSCTYFDPIKINDSPLEVVISAKILGLTISHDLKWNDHVSGIVLKFFILYIFELTSPTY